MNINRNNYETFFLLYVDNELSATERKTVELFTTQNPDLREELLMLAQTVLKPADVTFDKKDTLLKTDELLQQKLLLHLDHELNDRDKETIESLINSDSTISTEWELLQQAKLEATSVVFPDKHLLYRKEPAHVVGIRWWRIAAAAMLIGFGTWGSMHLLQDKNPSNPPIVISNPKPEKDPATHLPGLNNHSTDIKNVDRDKIAKDMESPVSKDQAVVNTGDNTAANIIKNQKTVSGKKQPNEVQSVPDKKQQDIAVQGNDPVNNRETNNNLQKPLEIINNRPRNLSNPIAVSITDNSKSLIPDKRDAVDYKVKDDSKTSAITAAYHPDENGTADTDDEPDNKKSKLRGLFRKVKRVLEKNKSNTGSIKIAGFDVAIK